MQNFTNYLIAFFKYLAIFISAISGCLALLVDFKKDGKITKWGKTALLGVVLSFFISAVLQGIEIYRNKEEAKIEEQKTQSILKEIRTGIFYIRPNEIFIDAGEQISIKEKFFKPYIDRINNLLIQYKKEPKMKLPKGCSIYKIPYIDVSTGKHGNTGYYEITILPESILYPNKETEKSIYQVICRLAFEVSIYKADSSIKFDSLIRRDSDLYFETNIANPILRYNTSTGILDLTSYIIQLENSTYKSINIESLLELSNAILKLSIGTKIQEDLNDDAIKPSEGLKVDAFSIHVCNRKFSISYHCRIKDTDEYILTFPNDVLVDKNVDCQ